MLKKHITTPKTSQNVTPVDDAKNAGLYKDDENVVKGRI